MTTNGSQSPNHREAITAVNEISQKNEYLYSSNHALEVAVVSGGGSGTQYAEGITTQPGTGNLSLGRYLTSPPSLTNGQMNALQLDSAGNLKVTGSLSVGGTTDNSNFTAGTSTGTPTMGFYHSTIDTVTDGRSAVIGMTSKRAMLVNLQDATGTEIGTATTPVVSKISDGTNVANVITGDTGYNSQVISPAVKTITFTTSVAGAQTLLANTDLRGYTWMEVNYTSVGVGLALTGQFATASGGTYITPTLTWSTSASAVAGALGVAVNTTYYSPVRGNFFQLVLTALTSGTFTGTLTLRAIPPPPPIQLVSGSGNFTVVGAKTTNAAVPAATNLGVLAGLANAAAPTLTETFQALLSMDLKGNTRIRISDAAGNDRGANVNTSNQLSVSIDGSTATNISTNVAQINGVTPLMGNGITGTGSPRVTIASDNTAFAVNATLSAETTKAIGVVRTADGSGNLLTSTGNALDINLKTSAATNISTNLAQVNGVTTLTGNGASGTGAQRITIASDSTGQIAPAANATTTGTSIYNNTALSSTKAAANASAGNVYGYHIYNPNSSVTYIQLFNVASASVTVGTTPPTAVLAVPAGGWVDATPATPITFGTALTIAATTTSTGAGTPTTALLCNIWFK